MSRSKFAEARHRTLAYLHDAKIDHHMLHGPASEDYWSAPLRVLAVNLESYGYDRCGHWEVDFDCLLGWMYDRNNEGARTVRYTISIIKALFDSYTYNIPPRPEHFRAAYADRLSLESVLRQVAYYNIRSTSNSEKREDATGIIASGSMPLSGFVRDEMQALDPRVILVSGRSGLVAFNAMWHLDPPLTYLGSMRHSCDALIQSIRHPSRPSYRMLAALVTNAVQGLKGS